MCVIETSVQVDIILVAKILGGIIQTANKVIQLILQSCLQKYLEKSDGV